MWLDTGEGLRMVKGVIVAECEKFVTVSKPGQLIPVVTEGCEGGFRVAENDGILDFQVQLYRYDTLTLVNQNCY